MEAIFPLLTTFRKGGLTGTSSRKGDIDKIIITNILIFTRKEN